MFLGVGFGANLNTVCPWIAAMGSVNGGQEQQVQSYSEDPHHRAVFPHLFSSS